MHGESTALKGTPTDTTTKCLTPSFPSLSPQGQCGEYPHRVSEPLKLSHPGAQPQLSLVSLGPLQSWGREHPAPSVSAARVGP